MKKLGIFGDSYAEIKGPGFPGYATGWSYKLHKEYNGECSVHAGAGSSQEYNFRQFLEHHEKYEKIIFVVTNLHRVSIPVRAIHKKTGNSVEVTHFPNIHRTEWAMKNFNLENNLGKIILDYLVYISYPSEQYKKDAHLASVSYIRNIRPDAIIVPAFHDCGFDSEYNWVLSDIDSNETKLWYLSRGAEPWDDPRSNHFSPKTNDWVLEHMKGRLRGEFIDWNPALTPAYQTKAEFDKSLSRFTN